MNTTIWKFDFFGQPGDTIIMQLPKGACIIHTADQAGTPRIWAEVDPSAELEPREFSIVGTGWPIQPTWRHINTWQRDGFVWHAYEIPADKAQLKEVT